MTGAVSSKRATKRLERRELFVETNRDQNQPLRISNDASISPITPTTDSVQSTTQSNNEKKKNKRGPTRMASFRQDTNVLKTKWNERGQIVGKNSDKFASFVGVLAREHIPMIFNDWPSVDGTLKEELWTLIQQKFQVNDCNKKYILRKLGDRWKNAKSRLTGQIKEANKSSNKKRELALLKPTNLTAEEWASFIRQRLSEDFEIKSKKFRELKRKSAFTHTMGRAGYANKERKMKKNSSDPNGITRVEVWCATHTDKNGKPVNEAAGVVMDKIVQCSQSTENPVERGNIRKDEIAKAIGPEKRGWVRALGFGATLTKVDAQTYSNGRVKELEQKVSYLEEKLEKEIANIKTMWMQSQKNQNKNTSDDRVCTPQSQGSGTIHNNGEYENAKCQLFNWYGDDINEVVAEGKIASTDPKSQVHHMPLGRDCYKVWVESIIVNDVKMYRPTDEARTLDHAIGSTVAWPKSCIKLL